MTAPDVSRLRLLVKTLVVAATLPMLAIVPFAFKQQGWTTFSLIMVLGAASAIVGALLGFIFGVPRVLTYDDPKRSQGEGSEARTVIVANTNLEQISDWLTKILVGVGLTQATAIAAALGRLFKMTGGTLQAGDSGAVFMGGLTIYCFGCGFAMGWLFTRLLLGRAMARADRHSSALALFQQAYQASLDGDEQKAAQLQDRASRLAED